MRCNHEQRAGDSICENNCFIQYSIWCRNIRVFEGELALQARILLLLDPNLHPLLHVGHRVVGVFLVGRQCSSSSRVSRRYNSPDDGHTNYWHQQLTAPRFIYEGNPEDRKTSQANSRPFYILLPSLNVAACLQRAIMMAFLLAYLIQLWHIKAEWTVRKWFEMLEILIITDYPIVAVTFDWVSVYHHFHDWKGYR